ncbi:MAG: hypothetical protein SNJ81_16655 [Cyanobacteriota bacterium]
MQTAQYFAGLFSIEDDAVLRELQRACPFEAFGVVEDLEAIDRQLRVCGNTNEVKAQAATARQFAGERGAVKTGSPPRRETTQCIDKCIE